MNPSPMFPELLCQIGTECSPVITLVFCDLSHQPSTPALRELVRDLRLTHPVRMLLDFSEAVNMNCQTLPRLAPLFGMLCDHATTRCAYLAASPAQLADLYTTVKILGSGQLGRGEVFLKRSQALRWLLEPQNLV